MTNPTYTDDQIETAIAGTTFPNRLGEMLAYVYADRKRLQAAVKEQSEQMEAEAIVTGAYFDRIAELEAEVEALRSYLRGKADKAYCDYIRQMSRTECLGWEAKVRAGRFTEKELAAHMRAGELLGRHRALHEAAHSLPRATPNETKEAKS